ncbi:L-tryptophan--pyruvate aminotransferase 1-like [Apium graveolens]|uniref:L-tryptophan--pyruvate aminotransferase 1-like n=1 Tax=Apium graveolens TaxID=4045 RepID=UPI003D79C121
MGKGHQSLLGFDFKIFFVLSVALNVGLISKVLYQGEEGNQENKISMICLDTKGSRHGDAHISMRRTLAYTTTSNNVTEDSSGGDDIVIDLDHGNPAMYEEYWKHRGDEITVVIPGWQFISYFSDLKNLCWFLEPELAKQAIRLHNLVGNAVTQDRHIVVGTGSSQLYEAILYALTTADSPEPMSVVSATPYYSAYPLQTNYLKSGLHRWAGDAQNFSTNEPYIEVVTSPNNPDGSIRQAVANGDKGILVHDLAYYWPQYTPITHQADEDIMLFTISKSTGHAGSRIGWALIKDPEIAKKMTKFMEISTIGVSKESQIRAARILQAVSDDYDSISTVNDDDRFFDYSYSFMVKRWNELKAVVDKSEKFSLPKLPPDTCTFSGKTFEPLPAFAWLKCEEETVDDCASYLRSHKILTRAGKHFGASSKYVRISMLDTSYKFKILTERLSKLSTMKSREF